MIPPVRHGSCDFGIMNQWPDPVEAVRFDIWQRAAEIATVAHAGQTSPGTSTPYVAHLTRVALLIGTVFGCDDPEILAAALLHDVLEKTKVTRAKLSDAMGAEVADWVECLSKKPKDDKGAYWKRLAQAPWQVRLIKMADALDHLNGPGEFRAARLKAAAKALALATSPEPALQLAATLLRREMDRLSAEVG